jgi:hypothetical protein
MDYVSALELSMRYRMSTNGTSRRNRWRELPMRRVAQAGPSNTSVGFEL